MNTIREVLKKWIRFYWDLKTRRKMERVFRRKEDPYGYFTQSHEIQKQTRLESLLAGQPYDNALEIGCAEGAFTRRLAGHCNHLWAMDISPTALNRARERLKDVSNVSYILGSILDYKPGAAWDLIVIAEVLYYLPTGEILDEVFRRISTWLVPGGHLLVLHSYANPEQRVIRKGYVDGFLKTNNFRLRAEIDGGEDPRKSKYLICALDRTSP